MIPLHIGNIFFFLGGGDNYGNKVCVNNAITVEFETDSYIISYNYRQETVGGQIYNFLQDITYEATFHSMP